MRFRKKVLSFIMVCVLCLATTTSVFASDTNVNAADIVQNVVDKNYLNASVTQLLGNDYRDIWNEFFAGHYGVEELKNTLYAEGYSEIAEMNEVAVKIVDNRNNDLIYYYYYKFYQNASGEKVAAMFIHSPNTRNMYGIYAEKIDTNNMGSEYYSLVEGDMPEISTYDTIGFLCGLSGTVACSAYSAMLFAFVPASIIVGLTCGAAFDWVCSR